VMEMMAAPPAPTFFPPEFFLVGDFSMCLSEARPSVEAELRDIDAEERSDVSARFLNERSLLG